MYWSDDEGEPMSLSPVSTLEDKLSNDLHNAKVDMSEVNPFHAHNALVDMSEVKVDMSEVNPFHAHSSDIDMPQINSFHAHNVKVNMSEVRSDMLQVSHLHAHKVKVNVSEVNTFHANNKKTDVSTKSDTSNSQPDVDPFDAKNGNIDTSKGKQNINPVHAKNADTDTSKDKLDINPFRAKNANIDTSKNKHEINRFLVKNANIDTSKDDPELNPFRAQNASIDWSKDKPVINPYAAKNASISTSKGKPEVNLFHTKNANTDSTQTNPVQPQSSKKVRFKDQVSHVRWVTSPKTNTHERDYRHQGRQLVSVLEESDVTCLTVEDILNANRDNLQTKMRTGREAVITKNLADVFRCYICLETARDARLCPHCSKLCCLTCIQKRGCNLWAPCIDQRDGFKHVTCLTPVFLRTTLSGPLVHTAKAQCPHCRTGVQIHNLVRCGWMEEVTTQVNTLHTLSACRYHQHQHQQQHQHQHQHQQHRHSSDDDDDMCSEHQEKLTVYCCTCRLCVCHHCVLFGGLHGGHRFKPVQAVYREHVTNIRSHVTQLRHTRDKLMTLAQDVEKSMMTVKKSKEERVREIRHAMVTALDMLESELKDKLQTLTDQSKSLREDGEACDSLLRKVERELTSACRSQLLARSSDIIANCRQLHLRHVDYDVTTPVSTEFTNQVVPEFQTGTFTLNTFSVLRQRADPVHSPPVSTATGLCWRLKVYPDGNGEVRGHFLSVFLELTAGPPQASTYQYRIEMVKENDGEDSKTVVRQFCSQFRVGECWGYNRFVALDLLSTQGYLTTQDTLTLTFHVRPPSFFHQCRLQQWYISELQATNAQHVQHINDLKQRVHQELCEKRHSEYGHSPELQLPVSTSHPITHTPQHHACVREMGQGHLRSDNPANKDVPSPGSSGGDSAISDTSDVTDCNDEVDDGEEGATGGDVTAIMTSCVDNRKDDVTVDRETRIQTQETSCNSHHRSSPHPSTLNRLPLTRQGLQWYCLHQSYSTITNNTRSPPPSLQSHP